MIVYQNGIDCGSCIQNTFGIYFEYKSHTYANLTQMWHLLASIKSGDQQLFRKYYEQIFLII